MLPQPSWTPRKERSSALYDLMDALDSGEYDETEKGTEEYLLAQNKLWVITGEVTDFSGQIAALADRRPLCRQQLGTPTQITAPQTGYFIRSASSGRLNAGAGDILALSAHRPESLYRVRAGNGAGWLCGQDRLGLFLAVCRGLLRQRGAETAGSGWQTAEKIGADPFPQGQVETPLKTSVTEVSIDEESGLTVL